MADAVHGETRSGPVAGGLLVLTDRGQVPASTDLLTVLDEAIAGGARGVVLREKDLPLAERAVLAERLAEVLAPVGGLLIIAGSAPAGTPVEVASGVHLAAGDPWPDLPGTIVGRSCHTQAELRAAAARRATYATVSPIFASRSKPGYGPPLGLGPLRPLASIPVFALGGVDTPDRAGRCVRAGAAGVAVMGAIMRASDPASLVAALLAAISEASPSQGSRP